VLDKDDLEVIKGKTQALGQSAYKIAEKVYRGAGTEQGKDPGAEPSDDDKGDDKVVDADYEPKK